VTPVSLHRVGGPAGSQEAVCVLELWGWETGARFLAQNAIHQGVTPGDASEDVTLCSGECTVQHDCVTPVPGVVGRARRSPDGL
jgi:hypothetical protein